MSPVRSSSREWDRRRVPRGCVPTVPSSVPSSSVSGFGGGVAALRLAQAGVKRTGPRTRAALADRPQRPHLPDGQDHGPARRGTSPRPTCSAGRSGTDPYVGLFETVVSPTMSAVCGRCRRRVAGVPRHDPAAQAVGVQRLVPDALDYSTMDRVHYPRVARMLKANVAPDALINSHAYRGAREFAKRARRAGMPVEKLAARSTGTTRSPRTTDGCGGPTRSATPCSV